MIRRTIAMAAAFAFVPVLAAQADDIGGEEIIVPTIVEEAIVVIEERPVSLPPPGITREQAEETDSEEAPRLLAEKRIRSPGGGPGDCPIRLGASLGSRPHPCRPTSPSMTRRSRRVFSARGPLQANRAALV